MTPREPGVDNPIIEAEAFRFSYSGAHRPAVLDITFAVQRHELFGFLGPSGARKSSTQNVLIARIGLSRWCQRGPAGHRYAEVEPEHARP